MDKIVSSVFLHFFNTKFGGRPNSFKLRYFNGLCRLSHNSLQKVVYFGNNHQLEEFRSYLNTNCKDKDQISRYEYKLYDIYNYRLNDLIFFLREKFPNNIAKDRSPQICYSKFELMLLESGNCENVYWCDAGLINTAIFPTYAINNSFIMSNEYFHELKNKHKDKMYLVCGNSKNGFVSRKIDTKVGGNYHIKPVGGFFGGSNQNVNKNMRSFLKTIEECLNNDFLYLEEQSMEINLKKNPELYYTDLFDSWYHSEHKAKPKNLENLRSIYRVFCND